MEKVRESAESQFPAVADPSEAQGLASFFKALSDETRLRIASLLWIEDLCMCEIVTALGGAASTVSHHLRIMEAGGLIASRREGKFTIYSVEKEKLSPIITMIKNELK
ncbi:ArsR family transcriptional regulator [Mesobacillus zeae]|uniref:ArsR family transcriptional regulator n=2 Tax=Mesobacillus zeae TaxID=1917180 RepID=A0A398B410_9BACI|nr:ArsR family transcriptional regulator [Mesobacillus zeae]